MVHWRDYCWRGMLERSIAFFVVVYSLLVYLPSVLNHAAFIYYVYIGSIDNPHKHTANWTVTLEQSISAGTCICKNNSYIPRYLRRWWCRCRCRHRLTTRLVFMYTYCVHMLMLVFVCWIPACVESSPQQQQQLRRRTDRRHSLPRSQHVIRHSVVNTFACRSHRKLISLKTPPFSDEKLCAVLIKTKTKTSS